MREVKAVKINAADFAPYGTFCSMTEPEGYPLEGEIHKFYPDRISGTCVGTMAFSPIEVRKTKELSRWRNIIQLHGKGLLLSMTTCLSMLHLLLAEHRFRNLRRLSLYQRDAW